MTVENDRLLYRRRWAMALAIPVLAVVGLVVAYRFTAPGGTPSGPSGEPLAQGDVLQVGALPVT